MTQPMPPPVTSWQVTGQAERTDIANDGTPVRGVVVYFLTGAGHQGSVFVPATQYTPDNVRAMIAKAAAQMDAVGALTSGG